MLSENFANIHPAEFRNFEGVPHRLHAGTIDLHALHERAQEDSSRVDWNLGRRRNKGISSHFAESGIAVKLFFQCFKGVAAKKHVVFELEMDGASADSQVFNCAAEKSDVSFVFIERVARS